MKFGGALTSVIMIERIVIIGAAALAGFPIFQWYEESPDRKRDRELRELQIISNCAQTLAQIRRFPLPSSDENLDLNEEQLRAVRSFEVGTADYQCLTHPTEFLKNAQIVVNLSLEQKIDRGLQ